MQVVSKPAIDRHISRPSSLSAPSFENENNNKQDLDDYDWAYGGLDYDEVDDDIDRDCATYVVTTKEGIVSVMPPYVCNEETGVVKTALDLNPARTMAEGVLGDSGCKLADADVGVDTAKAAVSGRHPASASESSTKLQLSKLFGVQEACRVQTPGVAQLAKLNFSPPGSTPPSSLSNTTLHESLCRGRIQSQPPTAQVHLELTLNSKLQHQTPITVRGIKRKFEEDIWENEELGVEDQKGEGKKQKQETVLYGGMNT